MIKRPRFRAALILLSLTATYLVVAFSVHPTPGECPRGFPLVLGPNNYDADTELTAHSLG